MRAARAEARRSRRCPGKPRGAAAAPRSELGELRPPAAAREGMRASEPGTAGGAAKGWLGRPGEGEESPLGPAAAGGRSVPHPPCSILGPREVGRHFFASAFPTGPAGG